MHPLRVLFSLYRYARDWDSLAAALPQTPQYYLNKSAAILLAMGRLGNYNDVGLMGASVFAQLLDALAEEAVADPGSAFQWAALLTACDSLQRARTAAFIALPFPYGSEMPWDSTGEEEIYTFATRYAPVLGPAAYRTSNLTLAAVKAYTPWETAHWAYHGSSRRYWDFAINGKTTTFGTERALQHYGSGINSACLLQAYRAWPNDTVALRAGYAATQGSLAMINPLTGAPSMALHGDPSLLTADPYSADWGVGFAVATDGFGCYIHSDAALHNGAVRGFGCDVTVGDGGVLMATARDAYRRSIYVGPLGLWLQSRNGPFAGVAWDAVGRTLTVTVDAAASGAACAAYSKMRVVVSMPAQQPRISAWTWQTPALPPPLLRGAFELPCDTTSFTLSYSSS